MRIHHRKFQTIYYVYIEPVPSMIRIDATPDDCMRIHHLKFQTLQDNLGLVSNLKEVGFYWNPSIIPWKDKYFVATR